jgi:hypothetical protein
MFGAPRLVFESIAEGKATRLEDIDVLEEEQLNTVIQSARYQQTLRRYHDKTIRHRSFIVGDLVLRRILTREGRHKLSPLWEGPFVVAEVTRPGSYRLTQMESISGSFTLSKISKAIGGALYSVIGKNLINKRFHSQGHSNCLLPIITLTRLRVTTIPY